METIEQNAIEAGTLEIYRYLPPSLLDQDPREMTMEDFVRNWAKARYIQKQEAIAVAQGIAMVFAAED